MINFLNFFRKNQNVILEEVIERGFLSNYITILTSFRHLMTRKNIPASQIFISPKMFSLYGNPSHWFAEDRIAATQKGRHFNTMKTCKFSAWPNRDEIDLGSYRQYIPYNSRVEQFLKTTLKDLRDTLGVHYRGTDQYHVDRIALENYLQAMSREFEKGGFQQVYVATDEESVTEKVIDYFWKTHRFSNIVYNATIKSTGSVGLHFAGHSSENKILLGDQVLLDAHSLSQCKTVICGASNIINYARALNPDLPVTFLDMGSKYRKGR